MIECYAILLLLTINNHCISVCLNKSIVICVTNVSGGGNVISRDKSNSYNSLIPRDPNLMLKLEAALE